MSAPDENHVVSSEKVSPCSVEKATSCNFCLEILNVSHSLATSMPRNVSLEQRYSFFVKLISGNDIDVFNRSQSKRKSSRKAQIVFKHHPLYKTIFNITFLRILENCCKIPRCWIPGKPHNKVSNLYGRTNKSS